MANDGRDKIDQAVLAALPYAVNAEVNRDGDRNRKFEEINSKEEFITFLRDFDTRKGGGTVFGILTDKEIGRIWDRYEFVESEFYEDQERGQTYQGLFIRNKRNGTAVLLAAGVDQTIKEGYETGAETLRYGFNVTQYLAHEAFFRKLIDEGKLGRRDELRMVGHSLGHQLNMVLWANAQRQDIGFQGNIKVSGYQGFGVNPNPSPDSDTLDVIDRPPVGGACMTAPLSLRARESWNV